MVRVESGDWVGRVRSFHVLDEYFEEFSQNGAIMLGKLDEWACAPDIDEGSRNAARFILSLWSTRTKWRCGKFDVFEAMRSWDDRHRAAFAEWVRDPWRP